MRSFFRQKAPSVLTNIDKTIGNPIWEIYGERYTQNRVSNPSFSFQWPKIDGMRLNQLLLPRLMSMTENHCSYCDGYPLKKGDDSIDHFLPKSLPQFYHQVCQWENLYVACKHCQDSKQSNYDQRLLRPDQPNFSFSRYFVYNFISHTIEVNTQSSEIEQQQASTTIKIFDLNHPSMCIRPLSKIRYNFSKI